MPFSVFCAVYILDHELYARMVDIKYALIRHNGGYVMSSNEGFIWTFLVQFYEHFPRKENYYFNFQKTSI